MYHIIYMTDKATKQSTTKTTQNQHHQQAKILKSFQSRLSELQKMKHCFETTVRACQSLGYQNQPGGEIYLKKFILKSGSPSERIFCVKILYLNNVPT